MSNLLKNKFLWLILAGFTVGGLGIQFWQDSQRSPASFPAPKLKPWGASLSGKLNQSIQIEIKTVGGVPDNDDQDLHLKAQITLNVPVDGEVKFQWSLPKDASLVSGELEDSFTGLQVGQTATSEIVIQGVSKEGFAKTVSFAASAAGGGKKLSAYAAFGTNSFEQMSTAAQERDDLENSEELVLKKEALAEKLKRTHQ